MGVVSFVAAAFTVTGIVLGPIRPLNGFTTEPEAVPETVGSARVKLAAIVVASVFTNLLVWQANTSFAIVAGFEPPLLSIAPAPARHAPQRPAISVLRT